MYRILMVAPTPFFADRGCHVRILGEILALQRAGCEVTLCTYHHGRNVPGVPTVRIPRVPWYGKLEAGPSNHKYYLDLLLLARSIVTGLRVRPDVVHGHLHEGALIGRGVSTLLRRPLIFDYQGSLTDEMAAHGYAPRDGVVLRAMGMVERWIDRGASRIVASTTQAGRSLRERLGPERVQTVLDGVETAEFRPATEAERRATRREYGVPPDAVLAVFVGVLTPYQGIDLLLAHAERALSAAPRLHLLFVGFPEEAYRRRADELGLTSRVTFTGKVEFERTPQLTAAADIAVTPKTSASEGNLKVYAYLACGLPVVAFDTPVNREILGDLGVYAPPSDGVAFADALAALANDRPRCARLARAGRQLAVEHLSWDRAAGQLLEVYGAAGARPGTPPLGGERARGRPVEEDAAGGRGGTATEWWPRYAAKGREA